MTLTIHPQHDWETADQPVTGPAPRGVAGTWVCHYPGSPSSYEPLTDAQMVDYLRSMQADYLRRGYSLGYSVIVSQSGSAWAARGVEGFPGVRVYNPASNPGRKVEGNFNNVSRSIQIAVGGQNKASPAAVATVNAIIATQPDWAVIWHGQVDWTSCAGEGIIAQIKSGEIGHQQEEDDMRTLDTPHRWFDTRTTDSPLKAGEALVMRPPNGTTEMVANVTCVPTEAKGGHIIVWGEGWQAPDTSVANWGDRKSVAFNLCRVRVGSDGNFRFQTVNSGCHLIVDIQAVNSGAQLG